MPEGKGAGSSQQGLEDGPRLLNPESQDLGYFDPKNFPSKDRSGTPK